MPEIDLDEIIKRCEQGKYRDIAQSGRTPCYEIDDAYVLVPHNNSQNAPKFVQLMRELKPEDTKNIYTVVDYRLIHGRAYELQKKAKGEHFRIDRTKQSTLEDLEYYKNNPDSSVVSAQIIRFLELYIKTDEYARLIDTRKDELLRRYSLIMQMPKEHIIDFFKAVLVLSDHQVQYDSIGNNLLYDQETGFSLIDLEDLSKAQPDLKANINYMLHSHNDQTMVQLLGTKTIKQVPDNNRKECVEAMRRALKRICIATFNFEYGSQRMTREIMEASLATYSQYGINLTYDEVMLDFEKSRRTISSQEVGKGTLKEQEQTADIDETMQTISKTQREMSEPSKL